MKLSVPIIVTQGRKIPFWQKVESLNWRPNISSAEFLKSYSLIENRDRFLTKLKKKAARLQAEGVEERLALSVVLLGPYSYHDVICQPLKAQRHKAYPDFRDFIASSN